MPDPEANKIVAAEVSYSPAWYKCFDELIVNAHDHKKRMEKFWGLLLVAIGIITALIAIGIWQNSWAFVSVGVALAFLTGGLALKFLERRNKVAPTTDKDGAIIDQRIPSKGLQLS